ncbi:MAG: NAD-dependent epimerase/dehydratase family protein [Kiloniellales bacterium]|nr:NAD-dependent epimerase/dehydratase family protein [Kiloniellales bacterium]
MKALVTGATGFVGSAVARLLLARGESVRVLTRADSDRRNIAELPVETAVGDLREPSSLEAALAGCDALFHVAADYRLWVPDPDAIYAVNVEGTRNLLRCAAKAGVTRMVYTSSVATLGLHKDGSPANEDSPVGLDDMIGHYKRSKFLAEAEVRRLIAEEGLPVVTVNPSTPIGPRDVKPTPTGRVIVEAASGRVPAFVDTGLNVVHVDDVAAGHLLAFDKGRVGERYILGGEDMSLAQILTVIAVKVGRKPPKVRLNPSLLMPLARLAEAWARIRRRGEPFVTVDGLRMSRKWMYFSSAKATAELGYRFRPAEAALSDAIDWFEAEGYIG